MKRFLHLALLAIILTGCSTKQTSKAFKSEAFTYEGETKHSSILISCAFPVSGDEVLCDSIYDFIVSAMTESQCYEDPVPDFRHDGQGFVDFFGHEINKNAEEQWQLFTKGDEDRADNIEEEIIFGISESTPEFMTYDFEHSFSGIADGFVHQFRTSFLRSDGSRVTNQFLFSDPSSSELLDLVKKELKNRLRGDDAEEYVDNISELPKRPFFLTTEGLGFNYEQFEVYMYELSGFLSLKKVKPFLTEEALKLFE